VNALARIEQKSTNTILPMFIIGTLFFVFGFVTWLNGSLIPFLKIVCDLNEFQAMLVTFAFYIAYTFMALPAAIVLRKIGFKAGMVAGLGVMAAGALLFIPAAISATYSIFLCALFVLGTGLTLLQTASNPYIVCVGARESAAMRISIMGLINKSAGVLVPLLFTAWILTGMEQFSVEALSGLSENVRAEKLAALSSRLIMPYIIMAIVLILLMVFVYFSPLPEVDIGGDEKNTEISAFGVLRFPQLVLGTIALFLYVGVEVIAGDTIGLYGRKLAVEHFGSLTSYTMGFMVLGYLVGVTCIPKWLSQSHALMLSALAGMLLVAGVIFSSPTNAIISQWMLGWAGVPPVPNSVFLLAVLGFANALVWPSIWPLALNSLGKFTSIGSALLIMGIAGGAILPLIYGQLAHASGNSQLSYWVMLPCYMFILFYALKGHKLERWK
jgi:MFS transporter, FHS family, L-fucose permease